MVVENLFNKIAGYIEEAVRSQNSSLLVDQVKALGLDTEGEANYMNLKCSCVAEDGSSIMLSFQSYDPSGPFQNFPDINKIHLQLMKNGEVVSEISERFSDKSIYGA